MKKRLSIIFIALFTICILSSCLFDDGNDGIISHGIKADIKVSAKYAGAVENENPTAYLDKDCTIKALDVPDYTFWYWEKDGEKISEDAEYTFNVESDGIYYAIYKPVSSDLALVNVVCGAAENANIILPDFTVQGGGYYEKGDNASLFSADERAICSSFNLNGTSRSTGPRLDFTVNENATVFVEYDDLCEIIIEESPFYKIKANTDKLIVAQNEYVEFTYEILDDDYVATEWVITEKYYPDYSIDQMQYTNYCGFYSTSKTLFTIATRSINISLECTNEDIKDTYPITVISSDGSGATFETPDKFASNGNDDSKYEIKITPNEDSYIKNVSLVSENTTSVCRVDATTEKNYDKTSIYYVPEFEDDSVLCIETIKKEDAAVVNVISNNDHIKLNKAPGELYPALSTTTIIVKKGEKHLYKNRFHENLEAIYRQGYQFLSITDEDGNFVSERMNFVFSVNKDTNFYINYVEQDIVRSDYDNKPIEEFYFDFHLLPDESGYEVRLSPLTDIMYPKRIIDYAEVLTIPSTYNGKPVTKIGDYGLSLYLRNGATDMLNTPTIFYEIRVPDTIKYIGEQAFSTWTDTKVVLDKNISIEYVAPDAFWSPNGNIQVTLSN